MNKQPETLGFAIRLESRGYQAEAEELRRLHAENEQLRAALELSQGGLEPTYKGWYCSHCQRGVDSSEVTFHEQHTACGRTITEDEPPLGWQEAVSGVVSAAESAHGIK